MKLFLNNLDTRYYLGRHEIIIMCQWSNKKALIKHLESGFVGSKKLGIKHVKKGDQDITLTRFCWRNKKIEKRD